jgi:hypothetical protein
MNYLPQIVDADQPQFTLEFLLPRAGQRRTRAGSISASTRQPSTVSFGDRFGADIPHAVVAI